MRKLFIFAAMALFVFSVQVPTTILPDAKTSESVTVGNITKFLNNITIVGAAHADYTCGEFVKEQCAFGGDWVRAFHQRATCKRLCGEKYNGKYNYQWGNCTGTNQCKDKCNKFC